MSSAPFRHFEYASNPFFKYGRLALDIDFSTKRSATKRFIRYPPTGSERAAIDVYKRQCQLRTRHRRSVCQFPGCHPCRSSAASDICRGHVDAAGFLSLIHIYVENPESLSFTKSRSKPHAKATSAHVGFGLEKIVAQLT